MILQSDLHWTSSISKNHSFFFLFIHLFIRSCSHEGPSRFDLLQSLVDRIHLLCAAFNSPMVFNPLIDELQSTLQNIDNVDPESILSVVDALRGRPLVFPYLLNSSMPSRTILHLAAALDFHQLLQRILFRYVVLILTLSILSSL